MYSLIHLVIWYFIWVLWHFSREYALHILRWCVLYFRYETYLHLCIMITLVWPIIEDIEPIDLGLGDRPREFETVTHFTFRSEQYHIHIHTLTLWTWRPTHFEPNMTPPLSIITRLYYIFSLYHAAASLPFLSIISLIWLGRVQDG